MRKTLLRLGTMVLASATLLAAPTGAHAADDRGDPPDDKITVEIATVNGSGCPAGTAAVAAASDNTGFTVTYSKYLARAGGSSDPVDSRKNCQLNLVVHIPQGYTYAVAGADYRGFASLQPGADGLQKANYYWQGMTESVETEHPITAPYNDNWQFSDRTDVSELVFKPCGVDRNLNINSEVRVTAGTDKTKTSFVAMDSTDGKVSTRFHFAWKECP